ncbi:MAG: hypothetical protein AAGH57_05600 [Pseudomonadota bacterium]
MTTFYNTTLRRLAAPALAFGAVGMGLTGLAATPALAGDEPTPIEVNSPSEMKRWKLEVSRQLDRALKRSNSRSSLAPESGVVQIAFVLDENGRADDLTLLSNSADWSAARTAKRALKRVRNLADAPVANAQEVRFLANIIFADNPVERDQLKRDLARSERTRLASGEAQSDFVVLGG